MPSRVGLQKCDSYDPGAVREALLNALTPLGGMGFFVRPGQRVLLKPNYVMARAAERAANTHPVFITEVARLVRDCGGEPFVGDSPGWGSAEAIARAHGLNLPVATLRRAEWKPFAGRTIQGMHISREVTDSDVVINLPKLKAHRQMRMTVAVKNVFGCVPGRRKAWLHMISRDDPDWFARMLVENCRLVNPALHIVDGVVAMEGNGPANGDPRPLGIVLAGPDPTAVDRVAAEVVGVPWRDVFTLAAAERLGFGETNLDRIEIVGTPWNEVACPDFRIPRLIGISFSPWRIARGWVRHKMMEWRESRTAS